MTNASTNGPNNQHRFLMYLRRSQDRDDRQQMSIPDQERELLSFAHRRGLVIVRIFRESRSAKTAGRPIFGEMMNAIEAGQADGIVVWDLNRLSRNLRDAGWVGDMFVEKRIREVATPRESYTDYHHIWSMWNQFLSANEYVVKMANDIARGQRGSLEAGYWPSMAKFGYAPLCECPNSSLTGKHRRHRQVFDPTRAHLVKELLRLADEGARPSELLRRARNDWHLTMPKHGKSGGGLISSAHLYRILQDPFYAGVMQFHGQSFVGNHEPLITWSQFQRIQARINKRGQGAARPSRYAFTYRGLIRCGACGAMVTAEYATNRFGKRYTYYHCSRKKRSLGNYCPERSVQESQVEKQLVEFLRSLELPAGVAELVLSELPQVANEHQGDAAQAVGEIEKLLAKKEEELRNLARLCAQKRITEEVLVADSESIRREEYELRGKLASLKSLETHVLEPYERAFSLVNDVVSGFVNGEPEKKREILLEVVSNLSLSGQTLTVEPRKPFVVCRRAKVHSVWTDRRAVRKMLRQLLSDPDGDSYDTSELSARQC